MADISIQKVNNNDTGYLSRKKLNENDELLAKAVNEKVDRSEMGNISVGLKRYQPEVQSVANLPLVDNDPGDARKVIEDLNSEGYSYIWLWDGNEWGRTPFTSFPGDVATTADLNKTTYRSEFFNVSQYNNKYDYTDQAEARNTVPENLRGIGQRLEYRLYTGKWVSEQFQGNGTADWGNPFSWVFSVDVEVIPMSVDRRPTIIITDESISLPIFRIGTNSAFTESIAQVLTIPSNVVSFGVVGTIDRWENEDGLSISVKDGFFWNIKQTLTGRQHLLLYYSEGRWYSDFPYIRELLPFDETYIDRLNAGISVTKEKGSQGREDAAPFGGVTGVAYNKGTEAENDGVVPAIGFYAINKGTAYFATGFVDQWGKAIYDKYFQVEATELGRQSHDINIGVNKGQTVFLLLDTKVCGFIDDVGGAEYNTLCYNDVDKQGVLSDYLGGAGGAVNFHFTLKYNTPNVNDLTNKVADVRSSSEKNAIRIEEVAINPYIIDSVTGEKYKIIITDGVIGVKSTIIRKVLGLGNSITRHGITSFWPGDFGMAAPRRENDWVHQLQTILRTKDNSATVNAFNIAEWELNHSTYNYAILDEYLEPDLDVVVLKIFENVQILDDLKEDFQTLIDYIKSKVPNATIVIVGQFWQHDAKEAVLKNAATDNNLSFVDISYMWGNALYQATLDTIIYGDNGVTMRIGDIENEATRNAVRDHTGDFGMLSMAQDIAKSIGY